MAVTPHNDLRSMGRGGALADGSAGLQLSVGVENQSATQSTCNRTPYAAATVVGQRDCTIQVG